MIGYCQNEGKMVEVKNPQTVRLPNLSYVQKGTCPKCKGLVMVKINDHQLIMSDSGHRVPMEIYEGPKTPKRILSMQAGQTIYSRTKEDVYITEIKPTTTLDGKITTVSEIIINQEEMRK